MAEPKRERANKKKRILFFVTIISMILIGMGSFQFIGCSKSSSKTETKKTEEKTEGKTEEGGGEVGEIVTINELVVNPKNTRGTRFFVASIGIMCGTKPQADEVKKKEPLIRDRLILFFSLQTLEVLSDISRREQIKAYVKAIIDREITTGPVKEVLFSRYIVQ